MVKLGSVYSLVQIKGGREPLFDAIYIYTHINAMIYWFIDYKPWRSRFCFIILDLKVGINSVT